MNLKEQTVLVLGLGASGLAMARWCLAAGAQVKVWDNRATTPNDALLASDYPAIERLQGEFDAAVLDQVNPTHVVVSPGLAPSDIRSITDAASARNITVDGELGLFQLALNALAETHQYHPKIIAITGTNGKTTVTSLTGLLIARAGLDVAIAGNIGPSLLDTLAERLADQRLPAVWVLELSSFQLHYAQQFEATAATILNLTQDHLDWHGSMAAYLADKMRIFGSRTLRIVNTDDLDLASKVNPPKAVPAKGSAKPTQAAPESVCFGADRPQQPGDYGLESVNGMTWLVKGQLLDPSRKPRRGQRDDDNELIMQRLMPAEALRIRGRHNALNALAALALAESTGAALAPMLYGLREYRGEPHRVEPIAIVRDVEYFDDSKGTNVGATVAAIAGLGPERSLVVILGGDGKGQDFTPLLAPLQRYARAVVLIGRDAPLLDQALATGTFTKVTATTLPEAVQQAASLAQPGDAVVLSPACASLDMFRHYVHRAEVFTEAVAELASADGSGLNHG